MQIQPTNHKQSNNTNFGALKKVQCVSSITCRELPCTNLEKNVIKELKDLAKVDKFFKENDVNAKVRVNSLGAEVKLIAQPVAKNFIDKIKIFFTTPKVHTISDYSHRCPHDSAFFVAKKLREMKKLAMEQN